MKIIEKNIPIPKKRKSRNSEFYLLLSKMEIGDSFLCPTSERSNAVSTARSINMRVKTRKEECGKVRVWRVE